MKANCPCAQVSLCGMNIYNHLFPLKYMIPWTNVIHVCTWRPRANLHFLFASLLQGKMDKKACESVTCGRLSLGIDVKYPLSRGSTRLRFLTMKAQVENGTSRLVARFVSICPPHICMRNAGTFLRQWGSQADLRRYACKQNVGQCRLCGPGDRSQVRDARDTRRILGRDREIHYF
ncbi:hypothetical protein TGARI_231996 [Toxoplasma gondii ARI]|uniref:Uncharacterized protein n=1 Tax=Toxoplasma gondii ARI TaxID=1074872 RepID=A0A139Y563_TOXGO|nr:hypothetical protein TGARI_231996 [Toxoplasma gondii ARI]